MVGQVTGVSLASWLVTECSQTGRGSGRLRKWCSGLCDGVEAVASASLMTCPRQGPVSLFQAGCCQRGPVCPWGKRCEQLVSAHPSLSVLDTGKLRTKSTLEIQNLPVTRVTSCPIGRLRLPIPDVWREEALSGVAGSSHPVWRPPTPPRSGLCPRPVSPIISHGQFFRLLTACGRNHAVCVLGVPALSHNTMSVGCSLSLPNTACVDGWQTVHPFPCGWVFGLCPGSSYYHDFLSGGHMHSLRHIPSRGIAGSYGKCKLNFSVHQHTAF